MQSHKAKPMLITLDFFYQSKDMYSIDSTKDKALYVYNILWNIQNSDYTVFKVWLVVHSRLNPYNQTPGIQKTVRNVYHVIYEKFSVFSCHSKYGIDLT